MSIKKLLSLFLISSLASNQITAKEMWWSYIADYDGSPGSILLNLALKNSAPQSGYAELIVTGITYKSDDTTGLPSSDEMERLNLLLNKVTSTIESVTPSIHAGTFTHKNEQLHYVYVKDSSKVKDALIVLYAEECPSCDQYINVKHDSTWSAYNEFLYPNAKTIDFYKEELKGLGLFD